LNSFDECNGLVDIVCQGGNIGLSETFGGCTQSTNCPCCSANDSIFGSLESARDASKIEAEVGDDLKIGGNIPLCGIYSVGDALDVAADCPFKCGEGGINGRNGSCLLLLKDRTSSDSGAETESEDDAS